MANVVKLKRGSGSDPQASDLVVGEVAIRTDNGKLFTKKDDNSVAEISGGGIEDGDKGDITVSNDGGTFTIDNDVVSYAKIQNVSATDRLLGRDSSGAGIIEEIAPSAVRTMLGLASSATTDTTNASNISSGTLAAARVATLNQDTTGSAATLTTARTIAGTSFDGSANIDISYANLTNKLSVGDGGLTQNNFTDALLSKLNGIAASATNVTNNNQLTNGAGYITATLTNEQVQDIIGGMVSGNTESGITVTYQDGDGTLDFSVASQTDQNFTTTLKNKLDGIESGATADQTAAEIRTLVGNASDSNVFTDALLSKLNGIAASATNVTNNNQLTNGAGYITATLTNEQVQDIVGAMVSGNTESGITVTYQDGDGTLDFSVASQTDNNFTNADHSKLDGIESGATADQSASEILTLIKTVDGSGSGLDADTLDGANASVGASNSTIVQRHSSGYIFANYFNTTPNDVSSGVTKVCVETGNDGYIRHGSAAAIRSFINVADGANNITNNNQLSNGAGYLTSSSTLSSSNLSGALPAIDGSNLTGISAGATGGGSDECFYENSQTITTNYTITNGKNAMSAGPITINSGVTVTVGSGENWTVV